MLFTTLALVLALGHPAYGAQKEGPEDAQQPHDSQTPAEQMELVSMKDATAKALFATTVIRKIGGPFREASFFSAKGDLLNRNNIALSGALVRRDGFQVPLNFRERKSHSLISPISWTLEMDRWPNPSPVSLVPANAFAQSTIGFGVEIDIRQLLRKIKK